MGRRPGTGWPGVCASQASPIHPTFAVLDANGKNVLESRAAVSLSQTCGACHDTAFIEEHSFHAGYVGRITIPEWLGLPYDVVVTGIVLMLSRVHNK